VSKRDAARAAVPSRDIYVGFVNEFHNEGFINEKPRAARRVLQGFASYLSGSHTDSVFVESTLDGK
jgi:hypothetical protein